METLICLIIMFCVGLLTGRIIWRKNEDSDYPELERMAILLLANNNLKDIECFTKSKIDYLSQETFLKLCTKIEELHADEVINKDEDTLKIRIDSLENKKIQPESFLDKTYNTLKAMRK